MQIQKLDQVMEPHQYHSNEKPQHVYRYGMVEKGSLVSVGSLLQ